MSRIYRERVYRVRVAQGLSGFGLPDAEGLTLGASIGPHGAVSRYDVIAEAEPDAATYRLASGRLPEYQDRTDYAGAVAWLAANSVGCLAVKVTPENPEEASR